MRSARRQPPLLADDAQAPFNAWMREPGESAMVLLRALVRSAAAMGVDARVLCARLDLAPERLDEDTSVPTFVLAHAWRIAPELSGLPLFGLHAGAHAELGAYDVLDYLFSTSATLEEALRSVVRFQRVLSEIWRVDLVVEAGAARFQHWVPHDFVEPLWHAWDYFFSASIKRVRAAAGHDATPRVVRLMHARAEPVSEYEGLFGCPVEFGQPVGEFVFDASLLARPLLSSNPSLHGVVRRHAQDLLARTRPDHDVLTRARAILPELLSGGHLSISALARELGVSRRTLQRALAEHGTRYKQLVDGVREELSVRALEAGVMSVQEVAASVGFNSQAAFARAFARWRGQSPTAFQRTVRRAE